MHDAITAILLGIIEGITEMLPVSSTGHLILANMWVSFRGAEEFTKLFDIVIQGGAILAVLTYFWKTISPFTKDPTQRARAFALMLRVSVGIFPILLVGFLLGGDILDLLFTPVIVATALITGGIVLLLVDTFVPRHTEETQTPLSSLSYAQVIFISLAHILGLIPGMSRAASATIGGLGAGLSRVSSAQFSMLLAVPTLLAASLYSLLDFRSPISLHESALLLIGFLVAWGVCYLTISWFFRYIARFGLKHFAYYRILLGALVLLMLR
jgi:undecaprenyl-diphosphatase